MKASSLMHMLSEMALRWENKEYTVISQDEARERGFTVYVYPDSKVLYMDGFGDELPIKHAMSGTCSPSEFYVTLVDGTQIATDMDTCSVAIIEGSDQ